MPKEHNDFVMCKFSKLELTKIKGALDFKIGRAIDMGLASYVDIEMDISDYIKFKIKELK